MWGSKNCLAAMCQPNEAASGCRCDHRGRKGHMCACVPYLQSDAADYLLYYQKPKRSPGGSSYKETRMAQKRQCPADHFRCSQWASTPLAVPAMHDNPALNPLGCDMHNWLPRQNNRAGHATEPGQLCWNKCYRKEGMLRACNNGPI